MPFADLDLTLVLTIDLFLIAGFATVVLLARAVTWPRHPRPGQPLPFTAVGIILGAVAGVPAAWLGIAAWWPTFGDVAKADTVAIVHFAFIVGVLLVQLLILVGWPLGWRWIRNFWLRVIHLMAILLVVGQSVAGQECPLTSWERELRGDDWPAIANGSALARFCTRQIHGRGKSFEGHLVEYVILATAVGGSWFLIRPRLPGPIE